MSFKSKPCTVEGCEYPIWSNGKCKSHTSHKVMKSGGRRSSKSAEVMHTFFKDLWSVRPHKSEVSGTYLGKEPLST